MNTLQTIFVGLLSAIQQLSYPIHLGLQLDGGVLVILALLLGLAKVVAVLLGEQGVKGIIQGVAALRQG